MRFRIVLYPGFDELDAIAPFEVLSMAARRRSAPSGMAGPDAARPPDGAGSAAPWLVELVAPDGATEVRASNGLRIVVDGSAADAGRPAAPARAAASGASAAPGVLIVPGGGWVDRSRVGARTEFDRGDGPGTTARAVREAIDAGAVVASVCTGAMLLARAGILRGRRCITHHAAIDDLAATGAVIVRARVVDDGDIVTAGGVTSGIDLALHLVERFGDPALADGIAATLEYERKPVAIRSPSTA